MNVTMIAWHVGLCYMRNLPSTGRHFGRISGVSPVALRVGVPLDCCLTCTVLCPRCTAVLVSERLISNFGLEVSGCIFSKVNPLD